MTKSGESFKGWVERKYPWVNEVGGGPWVKLEEIMGTDATTEKKATDIMLTFKLSFRQAGRWAKKYQEAVQPNEV